MNKGIVPLVSAVERLEGKLNRIEKNVLGMTRIRYKAQEDLKRVTEQRLAQLQLPTVCRYQAYEDLRREFGISSYKDLLEKDYTQAIDFLKHWVPRTK